MKHSTRMQLTSTNILFKNRLNNTAAAASIVTPIKCRMVIIIHSGHRATPNN